MKSLLDGLCWMMRLTCQRSLLALCAFMLYKPFRMPCVLYVPSCLRALSDSSEATLKKCSYEKLS